MQGSSWPTADDSFRTINEGTSPFVANIIRELAEAMEALQQHIGVKPHDFADSIGGKLFVNVASVLHERLAFEIGQYTHLAGNTSHAISFSHPDRFGISGSPTPLVFLSPYSAAMIPSDVAYTVSNRTATGFTVYRTSPASPADRLIRYLAINPLMWT